MHASQPLRVPVGPDAHRWRTFRAEKTLVVAARTVTSTVRVLECLPTLVRDDSRVSVVFAYDPTSAFSDGVLQLLHDAGCRVMPWEQLGRISPDLIVTASENIDVPDGDCPVLVLPHGVGFQKLVPDSRSARERLSGLVPDALLEAGRAWLAVSHPDQEEQLLAAHPKTAGRTLPVGDPCFDELLAGMRQRAVFRKDLGVEDGRRLVLISSTWKDTSLIGQDPELPARLLAALPYDEYRVALVGHPNISASHGSWQVRTLQTAARDAGLLLVPPVHAWRPALVAADVVIGDHGSVTLYGACLDIPVLLAAFGTDAVPGTAAFDLARLAPRLDPRADLAEQVEEAVRAHTPNRYSPVAERAFADPGQAHARLRSALYRLMELPEPAAAAPYAPPLSGADIDTVPCRSWWVSTVVSTDESGPVTTVRRHPAPVSGAVEEGADTFAHLACAEDEPDRRLAESASVIVRQGGAPTAVGALRWIADTLERFPGCLLTAVALHTGSVLVGLRDGRVVEATSTGPAADPGLAAAVVYACLRAGQQPADALVTLRIGAARTEDVALRLRAAGHSG
ncbi:CDP-glycerol glycerophosphotransferase family protein [Streptomyces sp. HUAS TT7]|uniref:CDP-glycerol glycerophosphotransferase family protein n=1 Tax=Streptomyces sp. HUAS TT7 TaxID=3447507 RepID=UPI003F65F9E1